MKTKKAKKIRRRNIIKEAIIEQVNEQIHSATPEEMFAVSNIILGTNFSTKKHRLISRL